MQPSLLALLQKPTTEEESLRKGEPFSQERYGAPGTVDHKNFLVPRQEITIRPHTRFTPFPLHSHNYVELLWQVSGKTVHTMEDETELTLEAGDLLLFGIGTKHAVAYAQEEDISINFIVLPSFFDVAVEMVGRHDQVGNFLINALRRQDPDLDYLHFRVADITPIQLVLESLVSNLWFADASSRQIDRTAMGLLFLHLSKHTERLSAPKTRLPQHILVTDALHEIDQNYKNADFSALAKKRNVSCAYLSRIVKQATQKTCKQLLQERRLQKAKKLLSTTTLSVEEVCHAVGYHNTSYFYRIFFAYYQVRPTAFRASD